ncbi:MAG: HAMP domain-containing histidine kinase [Calditrichaeota bacterium]|nr:HAMP domain-containing histidine kinase [Calditrichota bacterium]
MYILFKNFGIKMKLLRRLTSNPDRLRFAGMVVIGLGLLTILILIHFLWWPWMADLAKTGYREGEAWNDYRLSSTIVDGLMSIWVNHSLALTGLEKRHLSGSPVTAEDLKCLTELPGVKDAFYINLAAKSGLECNNLLLLDSLIAKLDKRSTKKLSGGTRFSRRLIGGLTKFNHIGKGKSKIPILVRYIGTFYPNQATEVIGIALDADWFIQQIPARADSLARNNATLTFMSPWEPDALDPGQNPYVCPNDDWQQTLGVVHSKDTLWWYGDRTVVSTKFGKTPVNYDDDFDIGIYSITQFTRYPKVVSRQIDIFTWMSWVGELNILLFMALMFYSYFYARQQSRRNKIALAHLAHSIKTPVARLKLATDILKESQLSSPEEEQRTIETISGECSHLQRAVRNAALSLEQTKLALNLETVDLVHLVHFIASHWTPSFFQAGVLLKLDAPNHPVTGSFDREKLTLALDNLIDNALRHTYLNIKNLSPERAVVQIRLSQVSDKTLISVEDSGAGIPKEARKKLFTRFSRPGKDPLTGVSGLGLGLALVKEIVEAHKGRIEVDDAAEGGAKFTIHTNLHSNE